MIKYGDHSAQQTLMENLLCAKKYTSTGDQKWIHPFLPKRSKQSHREGDIWIDDIDILWFDYH